MDRVVIGTVVEVWRLLLLQRRGLWFEIIGNSMFPTLAIGDHVFVQANSGCIKEGVLVLAEVEGRLIVHRVIELGSNEVILKGDNSPEPDKPIGNAQVIGVITMRDCSPRNLDSVHP